MTFRFVALKLPFKASTVRICPFAFYEFILIPFSNIFHPCSGEDISSITMFFTVFPLAWIHIFIDVNIHAFTLFFSLDPLSIILTFITIDQSSNTVFFVVCKFTSINITIRIGIFSLTVSMTINILALINLSVRVSSCAFSSVRFRRVGRLLTFRYELIGLLLFTLLFRHFLSKSFLL